MADKNRKLEIPKDLSADGRKKALEAALAKIEKDFGKGAIMRLGQDNVGNLESIPTGSLGLDMAL